MNNSIETKGHIIHWIQQLTTDLKDNMYDLTDEFLDDAELDEIIGEMLEQTYKLQRYLEKLRDEEYE